MEFSHGSDQGCCGSNTVNFVGRQHPPLRQMDDGMGVWAGLNKQVDSNAKR